jgi:hypothetical protein
MKAIAIARTFLTESDDTDICVQPEFTHLEDGHTGISRRSPSLRRSTPHARLLTHSHAGHPPLPAGLAHSHASPPSPLPSPPPHVPCCTPTRG